MSEKEKNKMNPKKQTKTPNTPFTQSSNTPYFSSHYSPSTMTTRPQYITSTSISRFFFHLSLLKDP